MDSAYKVSISLFIKFGYYWTGHGKKKAGIIATSWLLYPLMSNGSLRGYTLEKCYQCSEFSAV